MKEELASGVRVRGGRHLPLAEATPLTPPADRSFPAPVSIRPSSRRVLRALIRALCPTAPAPHSPDLERRVELGVCRLIACTPTVIAKTFGAMLSLLNWLPLLTLSSHKTFCRLDPALASALLTTLARCRVAAVGDLVAGIRSVVLGVYFDQPEVHAAIGYSPVPHIAERRRLRRRLLGPAPVAA